MPGYTHDFKSALDKYESNHTLSPNPPRPLPKSKEEEEPGNFCVVCGGSGKISATSTARQDRKARAMGIKLEGRACSDCKGTGIRA